MIAASGWQIGWRVVVTSTALAGPPKQASHADIKPLVHAHAHNDYLHKRPLFDALDQGFCSVEADIFLVKGALLVAHERLDVRPERTLEKLYLDPLRARIKVNGGRVYRNGPPVWLLVDVKSEAKSTYEALDRVLRHYEEIVSAVRDGKFERKAITVVVTGNRAKAEITAQKERLAGIDGRLADLDSEVPSHLMPWISDRWSSHFRWRGDGPMPPEERRKLKDVVDQAHRHGRLVRFWDTPEKTAFWQELRAVGVDLINTDQLQKLQEFLNRN